MPRTPLSQRLGSLFSSRAPSPAWSEGASSSTNGLNRREGTLRQDITVNGDSALRGDVASSPLSPVSPIPPVMRRFGRTATRDTESRASIECGTPADADEATSRALREAISEEPFDYSRRPISELQEPPPARLSPATTLPTLASMQAAHNLRHPHLLDNLGRSTFPSLALPDTHLQPQITAPPISPSPSFSLIRGQSSHLTSVQSLRSLQAHDRAVQKMKAAHVHTAVVHPPSRSSTLDSITSSLPSTWWFNHKKEVDRLLHEDDQAETAQEEEDKIKRRYRSPSNPLVFCHGLLGFDSINLGASFAPIVISHWRGVKEVLEANGVEVLITRVPATSCPIERAIVLADAIREQYRGREIHLIGHSMGGIDCRYVATHLQKDFKVLSVTSIASPHRGSAFANYFLETVGERLPTVLSFLELLPFGDGDGKAFECLTVEAMEKFNEQTPDAPGVQYFSWGASFEPMMLDPFWLPHKIVREQEGPNDGLVSVSSSKWGTYLGTLEDVSHLDLVGWVNTARYTWAEWTGRGIKFKPATFYLEIADYLARVVENGEAPRSKSGPQAPIMTRGVGSSVD